MRDSTLKGRSRVLLLHLLTGDRSSSSVPMSPVALSSGEASPGAVEGGDPCAGFITHDWGAIQPILLPLSSSLLFYVFVFSPWGNLSDVWGSSDDAQLRGKLQIWRTDLPLPLWCCHKFVFHLGTRLSVCRCFHVTQPKQFLIGRACYDTVVVKITPPQKKNPKCNYWLSFVNTQTLFCSTYMYILHCLTHLIYS